MQIPIYQSRVGIEVVPGPRMDVAAAGAPGQALQRTAAAVGAEAADFASAQLRAQRTAERTRALTGATKELQDLELEFDRDPDFSTAPQRFEAKAGEIRTKWLEGIGDEGVKASFSTAFDTLAATKGFNVKKDAFKKETDAAVAGVDDALDTFAKVAAGARNPVERQAALDQAAEVLQGSANAGYLSQVDAGKRARGMLARIDETEARSLITADPEQAAVKLADPKTWANLDEIARARLIDLAMRRADTLDARATRQADRAERQADKAEKRRLENNAFSLWRRIGSKDDPLTLDALNSAAKSGEIDKGDYNGLRIALEHLDENTAKTRAKGAAVGLWQRVDASENPLTITEVNAAASRGEITKEDFTALRTAVERRSSRVDEGKAIRAMAANPEAALSVLGSDKAFPNLDDVARSRLVDQAIRRADAQERDRIAKDEKAERLAERQAKAAQEDASFSLWQRVGAAENPLSLPELDDMARGRRIDKEDYKALRGAIEKADAGQDDADTYVDLNDRLGQSRDIRADVLNARQAGRITAKTAAELLEKNRQVQRGDGIVASRDYKDAVDTLKAAIVTTGPGSAFVRSDEQVKLQRAIRELGGRIRDGNLSAGDAPKLWGIVDDMLPRYQSAPPSIFGLPRPRFGAVQTAAELATVAQATVQALEKGELDDRTFAAEDALLGEYEGVFRRQEELQRRRAEAAAKSGGKDRAAETARKNARGQ